MYLIDGAWWRKWCDYVNFNSDCELPEDKNVLVYEKPNIIKN